ncbi:hypothetical protein AB6A40_001376 [Gnathostoma spinigerum]|uniref:NADH-cytochrome b5 reductase n=1 Tax=Gnathostoma spinigerum TaxID=75299 RepID=A0ABD6E645_9BILA
MVNSVPSSGTLLLGGTVTVMALTAATVYFFRKRNFCICSLFRFFKDPVTLVDPNTKYSLPLISREEVSPDTRKFRFRLPSEKHVLGLPVGQHVYLSAKVDNNLVVRPYTPISSDDDKGYMELLIKVYFKNVNPRFPDGGKMTQYLENLKIGDAIDVRGPSGLCIYEGCGRFAIRPSKNDSPNRKTYKNIGMIAGGTGITPILQVISAVLKKPNDRTKMWLLFANKTEDDILLRSEFDKMAVDNADRLKVWYTLEQPPTNWTFSSGYINSEMLENHMPPPGDDTLVLLCGPPPMINFACIPNLEKLSYRNLFVF